jgi:hypothetical protein
VAAADKATESEKLARSELNRTTAIKGLFRNMLQRIDPYEANGADTTAIQYHAEIHPNDGRHGSPLNCDNA